jgi:hypothetical protein
MKLLVSGCSFSSGFGFTDANIERNWPNQLAKRLGAELTNVAKTGYDNTGIFMNALEQLTKQDFDICLLQITQIDRLLISPNWHGHRMCRPESNITNGILSDSEYQKWVKTFILLNQSSEHWTRLLKMINIVQNLIAQGKYIRFVNGSLDWDHALFNDPANSEFLNRLIDIDNLPNDEVDKLRTLVYNQTKSIDLSLWVNPFDKFCGPIQRDDILPTDKHPGVKSHDVLTDLIYNYLTKDKINA